MKKTANPAYLPFKNDENNFDFFFLTALSGLVLFKLFFSFYFNWYPETKPLEYLAYPLGWVLVPLAGWAFTLLLDKWRGEDTREGGFYPVLVTAQFILVLFLFHPRWMAHIGPFAQLGVFLMAEGTALAIARRKKPSAMDRDLLYGGMVCLASFWVLNVNTGLFKGPWSHPLACLLFLVVIGVFHLGYPRDAGPSRPATPWVRLPAVFLLYGIVLAVLAWTVLDPRFPYNKYHFGFYLGPLADLLNGKSLLNNINAQYGVMVFYFLKIFFAWMPLGYRSFSLVNMTLTVLQYFVFFITCRLLFKGWALPLLALSSLLLINHFAYVEVNPFFFPSTGPLRFGFLYLLPLLVLLRGRIPGWRNLFYALEAGLTALAFFWSLDVAAFTVPAYLLTALLESIRFEPKPAWDSSRLAKRAFWLAGGLGVAGGFLFADIYRRTGEMPHWSRYLEILGDYSAGLGALPLPGTGYWSLILGIYYFSLFAAAWMFLRGLRMKKTPAGDLYVVVLLWGLGVAQFTYYLWRSHYFNLLHVCMPALLLAFYWLHRLRQLSPPIVPKPLRRAGFSLAVAFAGLFLARTLPQAVEQIREKSLPWALWTGHLNLALQDLPRDDSFARDAGDLMRKYSPGGKYLVYFFSERGMEVSMYEGISKLYPYNDTIQACFCQPVLARILTFDPRLREGDMVYVSRDCQESPPAGYFDSRLAFEYRLWRKLGRDFDLRLVEKRGEISAYRVTGVAARR